MGIHSIFDPFRADFSPMTSEPHLFVRTIEQVVTVSLRKYFMSNRQFEPSPNEIQQHFVANHPFVYFVIDKETDVTLMTGTIVNPAQHSRTT
ncbi:Serpin (serine protease inhibitor) [Nesidiocoris tenuis]|nr:Serpin (serine protease inhibitor) [Nesidiocoris tenuis]